MTEQALWGDEHMIDHEARKTAEAAMAAIQAHERHCGERWSQARDTMKEGFEKAEQRASKLHERINGMLIAVAAGALGLLANVVVLWMSR